MARGDVVIRIRADYTDKDLDRAIRDVNRLKTESAAATPAMAGLGKGFAAAGAALAGMFSLEKVTQFLKESAQAAIEDEKSMRSLAQAMTNVGLAGQLPEIETGIERLSRMFGIADDQLRPAFQSLALVTEDVAGSQKLLALALDISAGTGRELESVTLALAKAAGGQTTALGRLGVGLDSTLLKSKDMDAITAELARKFGGQAAAAADTYAGKLARITVAADEFKEQIGFELLSALDDLSQTLGPAGGTQEDIDNVAKAFGDLVRGIGVVIGVFSNLANGMSGSGGTNSALRTLTTILSNSTPVIAGLSALGRKAGIDMQSLAGGTTNAGTAMKGATPAATGLAGAIGILDIKARSASDAFDILYGNASKFAKAGAEAGLARADRAERLAAGLGIDVDNVVASNMRSGGSKAAETISKHMQQALAQANLILQNAGATPMMQSFNVAKAIFGNVAEQYGPAQEAVRGLFDQAFSVLGEKIEAARQIGQQVADGLTGQLSLATALETAKETGGSIVDAFVAQGARVQAFATNLQTLMNAGLSQAAFQEITSLGYQRGADVANALLTGNVQQNISRANEVYTSVNNIAIQTGNQAAALFGQAGIQMALQMLTELIQVVTGKKGKMYKDLQNAMTALAQSLSRTITLTYVTVGGPGTGGGSVSSGDATTSPYYDTTGQTNAVVPPGSIPIGTGHGSWTNPATGEVEYFANGGPIMANQPAIVGEMGAELFIPSSAGRIVPNDQLGGGNTYNITVQAGVGDPREIGRQVVEAITLFERSSGPVFART